MPARPTITSAACTPCRTSSDPLGKISRRLRCPVMNDRRRWIPLALLLGHGCGEGAELTATSRRDLTPTHRRIADFDGDGFSDLAIGTPDEDVFSSLGPVATNSPNAGVVHVLYGTSNGLSGTGAQELWQNVLPTGEPSEAN